MGKKNLENPNFRLFPTKKEPVSGRKGEKGIDDVRSDGVPPYSVSIKAHQEHRKFCQELGNGTTSIDPIKAKEDAQKKFTESRIAGRNGRGEKP